MNGDAATCNGDTGVNISALTRASQNNVHLGVYVGRGGSANLGIASSVGSVAVAIASGAGNKLTSIGSTGFITDTGGGGTGFHWADRTSSSVATTGKNAAIQSNGVANTSTTPSTSHLLICERNGGFCNSSSWNYFVEVGSSVTNEAAHYANVRRLLVSLGATGT
jgi:hypothetical protein